jgi:hypothetical protein
VEGEGVAVGEGDAMQVRIDGDAVGKVCADERLQVAAADERVGAEGREVQRHGKT